MKGIIIFLVLSVSCLIAGGIPIPQSEAPFNSHEVISDSFSGIQVVSNQILLIFDDHSDRTQQEQILRSIKGKVIGGVPAKSLYQIGITNPDGSIDHLNLVCEKLKNYNVVVYAAPRFVDMSLNKKTASNRKGAVSLAPDMEDPTPNKFDKLSDALTANKQNLQPCYKFGKEDHGKIEFRIIISPEGEVSRVTALKSDVENRILVKCLEHKIKSWQGFPKIQ